MIPQDLTYHLPEAAPAFFIAIFLPWLFWFLASWRLDSLDQFASSDVLNKILLPRSSKIYWLKAAACFFAWILAVAALMGPEGNAHYPEETLSSSNEQKNELAKVRRKGHEVIFLIDASASMSVPDSRTGATRLDSAKEIADQIVSRLTGESGALYAFTSETIQLSPLTYDYLFLRLMIRQIKINEGDIPGTDIANALEFMKNKYYSKVDSKLKTLILLTDGEDTHLESLQGPEKERVTETLLKLIEDPEKNHLRVYTIGLGSLEGGEIPNLSYEGKKIHSALNEELLRKIARKGRGVYYPAREYTSIQLSKELIQSMGQDSPFYQEEALVRSYSANAGDNRVYSLYYQIPLALALILLSFILVWPDAVQAKGKTMLLLLFLAYPLGLFSQESLKEAKEYFEAGDYQHAEQIYENLLEKAASLWEQQVMAYNLGTSFLAEKKYEKALAAFNQISLGEDPQPLLNLRLKTNYILALLREAEQLSHGKLDQMEKSLYFYRRAIEQIPLALQADCQLQQAEGSGECLPSDNLNLMKLYAKHGYAILLKKILVWRITHSKWIDAVSLVSVSMNQLIREVSLLNSKQIKDRLQKQYAALIVKEGENWQKVWKSVLEKDMNTKEKTYKDLFDQSFKQFELGLNFIRSGQFTLAIEHWTKSKAILKNLMEKFFKGEPQEELLRRLLAFYNYAYVQNPLQESTLSSLESEQNELIPLFSGEIAAAVEEAKNSLTLSYNALQNSNIPLAQFHLGYSRYIVIRLLQQTNLSKNIDPKTILSAAIETQHEALLLNRLFWGIKQGEKEQFFPIIRNLQKEVVATTAPFLSQVFQLQEKEFQKGNCQANPWGEAIPLFDEGWHSANDAATGKETISLNLQERTLSLWREALDKLNSPSSSATCREKKEERREEKKNQQHDKQQSKNEESKSSMEEVLRQLIEMDQEDRLPLESSPLQLKGVKPW